MNHIDVLPLTLDHAPRARPRTTPGPRLLLALSLAFCSAVLTWYGVYRLWGYNAWTLLLAQSLTPGIAFALIARWRWKFADLGLSGRDLGRAALVGGISFAILAALGMAFSTALQAPVLRPHISVGALLSNWALVGLGEELLFCGVLFPLLARMFPRKRRWMVVGLLALTFALWHLPGYIARGLPLGSCVGRMSLNVASWLFFGGAYALSGNLWLSALMHANTDYALSPLITQSPPLGFVFMALMLAGAWVIGRRTSR